MKNVAALTYLTLTGMALFLGGCALDGGANKNRRANSCEVSAEGVVAFVASGLHSELQVNCASCHSVARSSAPSTFADVSDSLSYPHAKRWVDFSAPSTSFFVERMRQGHNCGSKCSALVDAFTRQIGVWAAAEAALPPSNCVDGGVVKTLAVPVPASLALNQSVNLKFDLSLATPPVANAVFQITVTRKSVAIGTDPGAFLIEKPMFAAGPRSGDPSANIRVSKVNLVTERNADQYRVWSALNYVVAPRTFDSSQPLAIVPCSELTQLGTWTDTATIALELAVEVTKERATVPATNPYRCKAQANFDANVNSIFQNPHLAAGRTSPVTCTGCHRQGSNNFALNVAGAVNCETVKARANLTTPLNSLILTYPTSVAHGGGRYTFTAAEITAITNWLVLEK